MANIKSAKKRILVNQTKALQNQMVKSQLKTAIKKFNAAVRPVTRHRLPSFTELPLRRLTRQLLTVSFTRTTQLTRSLSSHSSLTRWRKPNISAVLNPGPHFFYQNEKGSVGMEIFDY